jgi:hypothetical protein
VTLARSVVIAVAVLLIGGLIIAIRSHTDDPQCQPTANESMRVGVSLHREPGENYHAAYVRRTNDWGTAPEMVRIYYSGIPTGDWPAFHDAPTVVSFKVPDFQTLFSGGYDQALTDFFRQIPNDGQPHYVAFFHEPEDDIARGSFSADDFRNGYAYVDQLLDRGNLAETKDIRFGLILMGWTAQPESSRQLADYLPTTTPDFIGWDVYPGISADDVKAKFSAVMAASQQLDVAETFITETAPPAWTTQQERADWIPMALQAARDLNFDGLMYFDSTVGGDFRLTSSETWDAIGHQVCL